MSEYKWYDSATQARLENWVAALCNRYLPEIVEKFNAFDGKILTTDGKRTKAFDAVIPYWYERDNLKKGESIRVSCGEYYFDKRSSASVEFQVSEFDGDTTQYSRKISYAIGEVKDGYRNDDRTGWRHDGTKERTDWTAEEVEKLKEEVEKAENAFSEAKNNARIFVS